MINKIVTYLILTLFSSIFFFSKGVGVERVIFEPKIPLVGKVEIYQQTILDGMKVSLFNNLKRSLVRYKQMPRGDWLMHKMPEGSFGHGYDSKVADSSDPAQIILLTLAIYYVEEVEQAFRDMVNLLNTYILLFFLHSDSEL